MKLSPIVLFVYNRPEHTQETIEALKRNELAAFSDLYIISDGAKSNADEKAVESVRKLIGNISGFNKIELIKRENNFGLAKNTIIGVSQVLDYSDRVIVLEDDDFSSPQFLNYMNFMLSYYKNEDKIFSISGFSLPNNLLSIPKDYLFDIFFSSRASSWGWATWRSKWEQVDWNISDYANFIRDKQMKRRFELGGSDLTQMLINWKKGLNNSWSIRWCYAHFKNNAYCVHPVKSYIQNIGHDGSGTHCGASNKFNQTDLNTIKIPMMPRTIDIDTQISKNFKKFYDGGLKSKITRFIKNL
ncbi:MAG TPA: sugar transferase [Bacteroidales bacterium]|nr:sugar transferase [Bacteroidales bacterium]